MFRVATGQEKDRKKIVQCQEKVRENVLGRKIDILREIQGKLK